MKVKNEFFYGWGRMYTSKLTKSLLAGLIVLFSCFSCKKPMDETAVNPLFGKWKLIDASGTYFYRNDKKILNVFKSADLYADTFRLADGINILEINPFTITSKGGSNTYLVNYSRTYYRADTLDYISYTQGYVYKSDSYSNSYLYYKIKPDSIFIPNGFFINVPLVRSNMEILQYYRYEIGGNRLTFTTSNISWTPASSINNYDTTRTEIRGTLIFEKVSTD
jgi:hypothetical protein